MIHIEICSRRISRVLNTTSENEYLRALTPSPNLLFIFIYMKNCRVITGTLHFGKVFEETRNLVFLVQESS
jgi:hypothetical protein